ncbi:MAG TPA: Gfo/Idh/MocA family oxidoreductase [Mariniphaga sp.]|nr:Gfo/Idh/MocA family oxidoreductase [Mariniphaga sp.]
MIDRRNFIKTSIITGIGVSAGTYAMGSSLQSSVAAGKKVGIIGLDTSHSIAFTKTLNSADAGNSYNGYKVVAAYPKGSLDIKSSVDRIEGYVKQVKDMGVEITGSIDELLQKVDVVLLETNDGRRHLEQVLPVLKAGKRVFIDKPIAASLEDAMIIFRASEHYGIPLFSASSLRYIKGADEIKNGSVGKVMGAETFSPASLEETHPDLFWYGIHGVETLFTLMGTGCKQVTRAFTPGMDVVVGVWEDDRIGTFRGLRSGKTGYGGTVFGEKGITTLGSYNGYNPLLKEIVDYFDTGKVPIDPKETIEIFAFMQAADDSKKAGGKPVSIEKVMEKARKKSSKFKF